MKHFLIAFLLVCIGSNAQVQKLSQLSSGKFIDSAVIMEEAGDDVFGYCLLYEKDRQSREVFQLEYVVLDKNLNKLTSISLVQAAFKTWMARTYTELSFVKKIGNRLIISVNDQLQNVTEFDLISDFNHRYINLNLDDFTFSKEYKFENFTKKEFEYKAGHKMSFEDFWDLQKLTKTNSQYILAFATPEYNPKAAAISNPVNFDFRREKSVKRFAILDRDLNEVWAKDINTDGKTACKYEYLDSDPNILLLKKVTMIKKDGLEVKSVIAYDIKTGELLGEAKFSDKIYDVNLSRATITKDNVFFFVNAYDKKQKGKGYIQLTYSRQPFAEVNRVPMLWKNLAPAIPGTTEFGELGDGNSLLAQDFIVTPTGNVLLVLEAYAIKRPVTFGNNPKVFAELKNMHLVEFDQQGKIAYNKTIEKQNTVQVPNGLSIIGMRNYGYFDYKFDQKLNKNGDFALYYSINDREGSRRAVTKKPLWTLGIISNVDGQYSEEKLPLYGDDVKIYPSLAKNGYVRLLEVNEKTEEAEMRLEKINY